jgi:hypothetical protein
LAPAGQRQGRGNCCQYSGVNKEQPFGDVGMTVLACFLKRPGARNANGVGLVFAGGPQHSSNVFVPVAARRSERLILAQVQVFEAAPTQTILCCIHVPLPARLHQLHEK